jgi:hypothetical protein
MAFMPPAREDQDEDVIIPTAIAVHEARLNTDSLSLLSNLAVDHLQQQNGTNGDVLEWHNGEMFLSPSDSMNGILIDNFDSELSDFLQGKINFGSMEGW